MALMGYGDAALRFQLQFVQLQKFVNNGLVRFFHILIGAKENRSAFIQKHEAVGQLLSQAHVMREDD